MKVRTMAEIQEDPERVRVTVDVALSGTGTAAQANRIQVLEAELDASKLQARGWDHDRHTERDRADRNQARIEELERSLAARDHLLSDATTLVRKVREAVWVAHLDEAMEKRHDEDTVTRHAAELAAAVAFVRASVGQPA